MNAALFLTSTPLSSTATKKRWYVARDGQQSGPYRDVELAAQAGDDAIAPDDLVWRPGFLGWARADEVPGLLIPPPLPEGMARPSAREVAPALRLVATNDKPAAPVWPGREGEPVAETTHRNLGSLPESSDFTGALASDSGAGEAAALMAVAIKESDPASDAPLLEPAPAEAVVETPQIDPVLAPLEASPLSEERIVNAADAVAQPAPEASAMVDGSPSDQKSVPIAAAEAIQASAPQAAEEAETPATDHRPAASEPANAVAAAGREIIAETAPDPGPENHVGALQGPNFEKLRSLLAAPNRAEPGGNPPAQPSFAKLRSQLNRRDEEAAPDGSSAKRRDRRPGSARIGRLAAFFLSGSAAGSVCISLYGWSNALDAASLCLQAIGVRIF